MAGHTQARGVVPALGNVPQAQFGQIPRLPPPAVPQQPSFPQQAIGGFLEGLQQLQQQRAEAQLTQARLGLAERQVGVQEARVEESRETRLAQIQRELAAQEAETQSTRARGDVTQGQIEAEFGPAVVPDTSDPNLSANDRLKLLETTLKDQRSIRDIASRTSTSTDPEFVSQSRLLLEEARAHWGAERDSPLAPFLQTALDNREQFTPKLTPTDVRGIILAGRNQIVNRRENPFTQLFQSIGGVGGPGAPQTAPPAVTPFGGLGEPTGGPAGGGGVTTLSPEQVTALAASFTEAERASARVARDALVAAGIEPDAANAAAAIQVIQARQGAGAPPPAVEPPPIPTGELQPLDIGGLVQQAQQAQEPQVQFTEDTLRQLLERQQRQQPGTALRRPGQ